MITVAIVKGITPRNGKYVFVGVERGKEVLDVSPSLMRGLEAILPGIRPASDMVKPRRPRDYILVITEGITWKDDNTAKAGCGFDVPEGGQSHGIYTAARTEDGWRVTSSGIGCGYWKYVLIKGKKVTPSRRR